MHASPPSGSSPGAISDKPSPFPPFPKRPQQQQLAQYSEDLSQFLLTGSRASRELLKYDESERRLLRAREVMEEMAGSRQCARIIDRHSLLHFSARVNHRLGITYSNAGDPVKAERVLRQAIAGMTEVMRAFGVEKVGAQFIECTQKDLADAKESLSIVLKAQQGNAAKVEEGMRVGETHNNAMYVRRILGAGATDAQVRAFDLAVAETVPLDSADACGGM